MSQPHAPDAGPARTRPVRTCMVCRRKADLAELLGVVLIPHDRGPPGLQLVRVAGELLPAGWVEQAFGALASAQQAGDHPEPAAYRSPGASADGARRPPGKLRYVCPGSRCLGKLAGKPVPGAAPPQATVEMALLRLNERIAARAAGLRRRGLTAAALQQDQTLTGWQTCQNTWQETLASWPLPRSATDRAGAQGSRK